MIAGIQDEILRLHAMGLLDRLLADKTTKAHILWGTDAYETRGPEYRRNHQMTPALITGENADVIKTRARKALEQQTERTRRHAEVFTPLSLCARMVSDADAAWFGTADKFLPDQPVRFTKKKTWKHYVDSRRMEITCGEAPYLVSRYDACTGEAIPIRHRIGLLDRKLRAVNENTVNEEEWLTWALRAFQATYGYEFQGDNLLIARVNLLMTYEEYLYARWKRKPTPDEYRTIVNTITWNLWQMDGLTGQIPYCREDDWQETNLFESPETATDELSQQPACRIYDWRRKNSLTYQHVNTGGRNMKFDFIIGNPPYQDETIGENSTYAPPIYNLFMDEAYKLSDKVELIHPARFLFNAGSTPKPWNNKMLNDPHFKIMCYEPISSSFFPNTDIKGGIVISYRDEKKHFTPIKIFAPYKELNSILSKILNLNNFVSFSTIIVTSYAYHFLPQLYMDHPECEGCLSKGHEYDFKSNVFEKMPKAFFDNAPHDGHKYLRILGREDNKRIYKFIRKEYVNEVTNLHKYKVFLSGAMGTGKFGEPIATPIIGEPNDGTTETYMSIGSFNNRADAENTIKYLKTKFTRAMYGILKRTQANTPGKWKYVPLQDFTANSDIDWSQSVADIDKQLYQKYGLDDKEIAFIETHVKEMK